MTIHCLTANLCDCPNHNASVCYLAQKDERRFLSQSVTWIPDCGFEGLCVLLGGALGVVRWDRLLGEWPYGGTLEARIEASEFHSW